METIVSALIIIGILILVVFGAAFYMLSTQAAISESARAMQSRLNDQARTALTPTGATTNLAGDYAQIILQNTGPSKIADLKNWDVILQYSDAQGTSYENWYARTDQWSAQIYQTISPPQLETVEPGILNPGEYLVFQIHLVPAVGTGTTNLASITTPNGQTIESVFSH